jgi:hypothetical protein
VINEGLSEIIGPFPVPSRRDMRERNDDQGQKRRGHRYSIQPSNHTIPIEYRDRRSVNYLDHSHQDGKIVPVRLALFAEMVQERSWTTQTLREVGGTEGVGVTFLEETFSSSQANPKHRLHQKAAQAVLKALLPEIGTDIRGQMRSEGELKRASGYADRPHEFSESLRILDNELRLITPTDPEASGDERATASPKERYYQLTHDYLVHSLRDWLTRKQRETRRGRAELVLEDRYALWKQKRATRHLPTLTEAMSITLFVGFTRLQADKRTMVKSALVDGAFYLFRNFLIASVIVIGISFFWYAQVAGRRSSIRELYLVIILVTALGWLGISALCASIYMIYYIYMYLLGMLIRFLRVAKE